MMPHEDNYKFLKFMRNWYYLFKTRDTPEKKLAFITTILEYAFENKVPDCVKNGIENLSCGVDYASYDAFCICQPVVDKEREDFKNGMKGSASGKKGGRPKKVVSKHLETDAGFTEKHQSDTEEKPRGVIKEKPRGVIDCKPPAVSNKKPGSFKEYEYEEENEYENEQEKECTSEEVITPKPPKGGLSDSEIESIEHSSDVRDARARADAGRTPTDEEVYACARKHGHPQSVADSVIRQIRESDSRYFSRNGKIVYIGIKNLSIVMSNFKAAAAMRDREAVSRSSEAIGQRMSAEECERSLESVKERSIEEIYREAGI